MVKLSDIELPVVFKNQLLFKAGEWNRWKISDFEVNKSVTNTSWNKINSSLIFKHRDKDKHEYAESWVGHVKNIYAKNGSVYGDLHVFVPDAAVALKYGEAPMAVSAGIAWPEQFDNPQDFVYRNFSLVIDPGVRDKEIFINFSADENPTNGFRTANFSNVVTSESASGSEIESSTNEKVEHGKKEDDDDDEHEEGCECDDCKKKADMENSGTISQQIVNTEQMAQAVVEKKEQAEGKDPEKKSEIHINTVERRLQDKDMQKDSKNSDFEASRLEQIEAKITNIEAKLSSQSEVKANFEEAVVAESPKQEVQAPVASTPQPVVPQQTTPVMGEDIVEKVASKVADKLAPTLRPIPMTTNEFVSNEQNVDPHEAAIDRLAKDLSNNRR